MGELLVHFRQGEKVDEQTRLWILESMEKHGGHNGDVEMDMNTCYSFFYGLESVRAFAEMFNISDKWLNITDEDGNEYHI